MGECIWIHYARPRPHWYRLDEATKADRKARWQEVAVASLQKGGVRLGTYHVRGQHDFETVEIWRFPTAEAAFDHWTNLTARSYGEWFAFLNNVGLAAEAAP
jgi:hypothetical protein